MEIGSLSANRNLIIILIIIIELGLGGYYYWVPYRNNQAELKSLNEIVERKNKEVREIEMTKKMLAEKRKEIERLKADISRLERYFPEDVFIPRVLVLLENLAEATHLRIEGVKPGSVGAAAGRPSGPAAVKRPQQNTNQKSSVYAQASKSPTSAPNNKASAGRGNKGAVATTANPQKEVIKFDSNKEYKTINVDFNVIGTFSNISNFMNELTTFPKLVVVDTITLAPRNTGSSKNNKQDNSAKTDVGISIELNAKMPLMFYIQQEKAPEF